MRDRLGGMLVGAATGALAGWVLSIKILNAGVAYDLLASRQWFALASLLSTPVQTWVPACMAVGAAGGLGWSVVRRRLFPSPGSGRLLARLTAAVGGLAAIGAAAVVIGPGLRPEADGPNILVIVLDTARPDRFSLYGYERPTTPNLVSLASESVVFTNSYSTSSWTPPWHASLFTGLHPCSHGVTQEQQPIRLPSRFLTLAEQLWEAGYRTLAVSGNPLIAQKRGFGQGFDAFHETWRTEASDDAPHPAITLMRDLIDADSDRPFFAFVNLIEPHSPYDSSREYFGLYDRHPDLEFTSNFWWDFFTKKRTYTSKDLEHLSDLYDEEIQYADSVVGEIVYLLAHRGMLDNTILVVTSDHGEHFGEHGLIGHYFNLYEGNVRTALLIRYPSAFTPGTVDTTFVQPVDLFAEMLSLADSPVPERSPSPAASADGAADGRSLFFGYGYPNNALGVLSAVYAGADVRGEPSIAPYLRRVLAVRHGRFKLIAGSDSSLELYDLSEDPGETENLALKARYQEAVDHLTRRLEDWQANCSPVGAGSSDDGSVELDEATRRSLRSLGYIR